MTLRQALLVGMLIDAVLATEAAAPAASATVTTTGCTGASANLTVDQCAAWGKFWDGLNLATVRKDCSKSDPCGSCRGVHCSGGSITEISMQSSGLHGTISNAIGAFVDMEYFNVFGNRYLTGSLPASMSAWKKLKSFLVRGCNFEGVLPALNYGALKPCYLLDAGGWFGPPVPDFSCPFPPGVTEKCFKFNGDMEFRRVTNADCHNATAASHVL